MDRAKKFDTEKVKLHLLPFAAVEEVAQVFTFGAKKYGEWNYREGMAWSRMLSAMLRHLFAWGRGEDRDPESGLRHLAHAGCCLLMLLDADINGLGTDDRWRKK